MKVSNKTCKETSSKSSADMAPGGVKPRSKKRVVADQQSTRTIRPKRSLAASDIPVPTPTPSVSRTRQDEENVGNFDDHLQPFVQGKFYNHTCYHFFVCFDWMISTFLLSTYF